MLQVRLFPVVLVPKSDLKVSNVSRAWPDKETKEPSNLLCLLLLADILPVLSRLSLFFQHEAVHLG